MMIRDALKSEAEYLSNLALRSKAYWGYTPEFIEICRPFIKFDIDYIVNWPVRVCEFNEKIVGVSSLKTIKGEQRLDNLWIEPKHIGQGYGQLLYKDACEQAKLLKWDYFRLAGEPNAIKFYEKMGAVQIGEIESCVRKNLFLPHMETKINEP